MSPLGRPRLHLRHTDSTNSRARELAMAGAPHGTLITAAEQSAGRGRQGRRWQAPPGSSLLMSLLLRDPPRLLPLIAAVAICDALGNQLALIKWPNDIVLARASEGEEPRYGKLAGVLTEGRPQERWAVVGLGLNVAVRLEQLPDELRETAASLEQSPEAIEPLLERLLAALGRRLGQTPEQILAAWRERDVLRGRHVAWQGGEGRAQGVDEKGRLLVARADGELTALEAGEVHLV